MRFIGPEEEAALIASGERPYSISGRDEFEVRDGDGVPTGQYCRAYKVDPATGVAALQALSGRTMTQGEMDVVPMRGPDGSVKAITYGEYRKRMVQ